MLKKECLSQHGNFNKHDLITWGYNDDDDDDNENYDEDDK